MLIRDFPTPNCGERRGGARVDCVVLHYTAMTGTKAVLHRLACEESQVSAHYVVSPAGDVWRMVDEAARAWHAGEGRWGACAEVNSRSIGIEIVNSGHEPFAAAQICVVEALLRGIMERWDIPPERVIGHSDMAPGRKIDPGRRFDWRRLALQGLAVWSEAEAAGEANWENFLQDARVFGYTADVAPEVLLETFRMRFRPAAQEDALESADCSVIADLAMRYPALLV